jgi:hypothetical protein
MKHDLSRIVLEIVYTLFVLIVGMFIGFQVATTANAAEYAPEYISIATTSEPPDITQIVNALETMHENIILAQLFQISILTAIFAVGICVIIAVKWRPTE